MERTETLLPAGHVPLVLEFLVPGPFHGLVVLLVLELLRLLRGVDERNAERDEDERPKDQVPVDERVSVPEGPFGDGHLFPESWSSGARVKLGGEVRILESAGLSRRFVL